MNLKSSIPFALLCLLFSVSQSPLAAEGLPRTHVLATQGTIATATFANVTVKLPIPAGYCEIPRTSIEGRRFYSLQEQASLGRNVVALMFADCREWAQRQSDPFHRVRRYGSYLFQLSEGKESLVPSEYSRSRFVKEVSGVDLDSAELAQDSNKRISQATIKAASMETVSVTPLSADTNGAYVMLVATMKYPKEQVRVCGVIASTMVRQVPVSMNLFRDFEGDKSVSELLRLQKLNAQVLVQEN